MRKGKTVLDYRRLQQAWAEEEKLRSSEISQKDAAEDMRVSPGYISQLLHGRRPINLIRAIQLATFLRREPSEIWPNYPKKFLEVAGSATDQQLEWIEKFLSLSPRQQAALMVVMDDLKSDPKE